MNARIAILGALLLALPSASWAAELDPAGNYRRDIKPLLKERCYACHGALKQEAGLRLDTGELVRRGSENGKVIAEDPDNSALIERIVAEDLSVRMPPIGKPLTAEEVKALRDWVSLGAPSPQDELPETDPAKHWAFQRPEQPPLPAISRPQWAVNPIDLLLHADYDRRGLTPAQQATPAERLRRVYLDLVGLPPSPDEVRDFLADPSDEAYRRTVSRLLSSPQYGERWARHWMDVWRYSDWYGRRQQNDVRNSAPQIWRWRDWIVDSLNQDKSYARMVQEMLAADELAAEDDSAWPATGYLIRSYYSLNPNEWMRHNVEYTGKAFLGLTFNCAHCHDHKYDPIEHDDYFRMRAFFEPIGIRQDRVLGEPEPPPFQPYTYSGSRKVVRTGMVRVFDEKPEAPTWFYTGGDERNKQKDRGSIAPGVPKFLNVPLRPITEVDLPMPGWYPGSRPSIQQAVLRERQEAARAAAAALQQLETPAVDLADLEAKVHAARQAFERALQEATAAGEGGPLSGRQSLLLEAPTGRRIVQQSLSQLKSVPEGTSISFRLRILQDQHVNFQLARDTTKSLTALYVGFVEGKIRAYKPGGFNEFIAGSYDFAGGQNDFQFTLVLQPASDTALLSVALNENATPLVDNVPIALNGWNAAKHPHQPLTLDCRSGTRAVIDDLKVIAGQQTESWDFESPAFEEGADVDGVSGWTVHSLSVAPARSVVSMAAGCDSTLPHAAQLRQATAALKAATLPRQAAQLGVEAANLRLQSAEATIAADNASRGALPEDERKRRALAARDLQKKAAESHARWRILKTQLERDKTVALPDDDKSKSTTLAQLDKQLAAAKADLSKALQGPSGDSIEYARLSPTTSPSSSGRRSSLAYWITDRRNPLTARVAINHIWMRHFQAPLVESVYDFGRNGKPPTHPRLLDWLAVELMDNQWSMKHIHRLIVTSRAYQMSSAESGNDANRRIDEDNRYLWRMNRGRMEAEVVRDSILSIAGKLDPTAGGQPLLNSQAMTTFRRSLYYEVFPEDGGTSEFKESFDPPDPTECFRRTRTIVPQQALALSNAAVIHQASRDAARQMPSGTDQAFVSAAFLRVLARRPEDDELQACLRFLERQGELLEDPGKVREGLIRVLFNHNDFVTIQ